MLPQSLAREMHRQLDNRPRLRSLAKSLDLHASRAFHTVVPRHPAPPGPLTGGLLSSPPPPPKSHRGVNRARPG